MDLPTSTTLGFAKFRGGDFLPARRLGALGPNMLQVEFFGTGVVSSVAGDGWIEYSEEREKRFTAGREVNAATFAMAVQELKAAMGTHVVL